MQTLSVNKMTGVRGVRNIPKKNTSVSKLFAFVPSHADVYIPPLVEELRQVQNPSSIDLKQLGVDDLCPVSSISKNSPADTADIETGDIIEEVKSIDRNVYELLVVHPDGNTVVEYIVIPF